MHMSNSEQLAKVLADEVRSFGLFYAGTDDDRARAHLAGYCAVLKSLLMQSTEVAKATRIVEAFERAVLTNKLELEVRAAMAHANRGLTESPAAAD